MRRRLRYGRWRTGSGALRFRRLGFRGGLLLGGGLLGSSSFGRLAFVISILTECKARARTNQATNQPPNFSVATINQNTTQHASRAADSSVFSFRAPSPARQGWSLILRLCLEAGKGYQKDWKE